MKAIHVLSLVLVLSLLAAGLALANSVELPREVLAGGASDSAAGNITLRATLGQPVVGAVDSGGGALTLGQGFWLGGRLPESTYTVYLPLVRR
jgi:hypothetical protein